MYLKFKIEDSKNKWKVYECKMYSHESFKLSEIIDFLLEMRHPNEGVLFALPHWMVNADLIIIPKIDNHLDEGDRVISNRDVNLLNTNCLLFTISTTYDTNPIYVLTTKQVFIESDKGQTIGRFNPNVLNNL